MNQSFYIGAIGAQQQLQRLNVHGDNIANVNTYGFKADRSHFEALMYQNHRGVEEELPMGVGGRLHQLRARRRGGHRAHPGLHDRGRGLLRAGGFGHR